MTKLSSVPTPLKHWLEGDLLLLGKTAVWTDLLTTLLQTAVGSQRRPFVLNPVFPLAAIAGITVLGQWHGTLWLALGLGAGSAIWLHRALAATTATPWSSVRQWLRQPNAPLWLSVGSGLAILVGSYGILTVGQHLHSPWLTIVLLGQEMVILTILALAVYLLLTQPSTVTPSFEQCVTGLLHRDELRRLVAVRQLGQLIAQDRLSPTERSHALDYLHLLSQRENSLLVQKALQEGLALLKPAARSLPVGKPALALSVNSVQQAQILASADR